MTLIKHYINKYIKGNEVFSRFVNIFSVDVIVRGANFLLIPVFLYLMTKEEFGVYGYLYSFAMTVSGIFSFGFYVSMTKLYADNNADKHKQASMLFTVTTTLLFLVGLAMLIVFFSKIDIDFFSLLNKSDDINSTTYLKYRLYVFVAILSMVFTNYLTFYFVGSDQIRKLQAFNIIRFLLANGTAVLVLYFSSLDSAILRLAITYVAELLLTIIFGSFLFKNFSPKYNVVYLKKAFKIGMPIMVAALMSAMMNFGDKFFVMKYAGANDFAVYNLGILLATIVLIVYQSFNFIWFPLFLREKDLAVLRRKTRRYILIIFFGLSAIGLCLWLGTFIALEWKIIPQKYYGVLPILPILILSQIFAALVGLLVNYITYFEKTYILIFVGASVSIFGYFLYDYFVKGYLGIGAALVLLILNIVSFIFYYARTEYYINNRLK